MYRSEVRTVTGHGSLILNTPLRYNHDEGNGVFLYQSEYDRAYDEWYEGETDNEETDDGTGDINITIGGGTPNQSDFEESDTSQGSQGKLNIQSGSSAYKDFRIRWQFPYTFLEIDDYQERFGEEVLRVSPRTDNKDREFYDRIRRIKDVTRPHP